jgi:glucose-1-phosphate cytidylyltransferase|tara:strand:+ start:512 stop:1291 length:780 start_codon:yes stop_codon:yes gene_type:complete
MELVILCGGKGTRLSEETVSKPKPLVEIDGKPILWHIMKYYSCFGINKFILALGYKGEVIKQYFLNYRQISSDFLIKLNPSTAINYLNQSSEKNWEIKFINTGENNLKGSRIKQLEKHISEDTFLLTYGDGIANVDILKLIEFHKAHDKIATVTAVRPPSRFGELKISENNTVLNLEEKPQMNQGLINGGFFVLNKRIMSYLTKEENCDFEFGPLQKLASDEQLIAFQHSGFWQCMDNVREKNFLDQLLKEGKAPWKIW